MKKGIRLILAATGAVLLASQVAGCSAMLPGGIGKCDITIDYPHGSTRKAGYIDGKGKMTCTIYKGHKITGASIETRLQKWSGKAWVTVGGTAATTKVGTVKNGVTYTGVSGFIVCQKGTFRTQSRGTASLDGAPGKSSEWATTNDDQNKGVKNPCEKPLKVVNVR
ncbi:MULTISPECIES: hypothetical protein [unclassified Leucobacter]|uniref:hypothetical protein n=1 Tax=unclassified Leucobacter TaxID=2621730 RepID=UPI000AB0FED0|nr:hypothetical protein [Leucobacter sp. Ag1]